MPLQSACGFGKAPVGPPVNARRVAVIGGGPAGLRAAEVAAAKGAAVTVFDAKASVGRKFLIAGRGGLNLTHAGPFDRFVAEYDGPELPKAAWRGMLAAFDADALRAWASGLGVETFAASTGRVYPREMKAAPLLRRWVQRLRALGVRFAMHHRWTAVNPGPPLRLAFTTPDGGADVEAEAAVLALGGASWPQTGSDGAWVPALAAAGVAVSPLAAANCGWETAWPAGLAETAAGLPLKNISAAAGEASASGELLITRYGLEGGVIYRLGHALRAMAVPVLVVDLKPSVSVEQLVRKMGSSRRNLVSEAVARWRLSGAAAALLQHHPPAQSAESPDSLARIAKAVAIALNRPRPIAEAISSAGGVCWRGLDDRLMVKSLPGVFCAGEMVDWEAPTGGYLMQACFATGTRAGAEAADWTLPESGLPNF